MPSLPHFLLFRERSEHQLFPARFFKIQAVKVSGHPHTHVWVLAVSLERYFVWIMFTVGKAAFVFGALNSDLSGYVCSNSCASSHSGCFWYSARYQILWDELLVGRINMLESILNKNRMLFFFCFFLEYNLIPSYRCLWPRFPECTDLIHYVASCEMIYSACTWSVGFLWPAKLEL